MDKVIIHLQTRRREVAQRFSLFQHGLAAVLLFTAGFNKLLAGESEEFVIAWLELLAGAAVIVSAFFELRKSGKDEHSSIKWLDIFAGLMLIVEGISKFHAGPKHYPMAFANFLAAIMTALVGIFHHKIVLATRITLDENGIKARTSPVRKLQLNWSEIESIAVDEAAIRLTTAKGERRIRLKNLTNAVEVRERFLEYLRSNEIAVPILESGTARPHLPVKVG